MLFLLFSFCVNHPFGFSIYLFFLFFFFFFLFSFFFLTQECRKRGCTWKLPHTKHCMTTSKLVGILKSFPSILDRIKAPPEKDFFTTYKPLQVGANFPLCSTMSWLHFFKTRPPSSKTLGLTFLLNARLMQRCYNCPWHIAVMLFSSIIFNFLYREWAHLTSHSFVVIRF